MTRIVEFPVTAYGLLRVHTAGSVLGGGGQEFVPASSGGWQGDGG